MFVDSLESRICYIEYMLIKVKYSYYIREENNKKTTHQQQINKQSN